MNNDAKFESFLDVCIKNRMSNYRRELSQRSFFICVDEFDDIPGPQSDTDINLIIEEIRERLSATEEQIFDCMLHGPSDIAGISKKTGMNRDKIDYSTMKIREKVRKYNG
jgi:predicted mannosyl-3-phosphoglycerate phosphatase (HAD superfamily)